MTLTKQRLTDYELVEGKGFWLIEHIVTTYFLGLPVCRDRIPVTNYERASRGWYIFKMEEFYSRQSAVNFINNELAKMGSKKRYKA